MNNLEKKCWLLFIGFLVILLCMVSCKSTKPSIDNENQQITNKSHSDISNTKVTKTPDSNDSLFVPVPPVKTNIPSCDSVCQAKIDELFSRLNTKKSSGKNTTGIYYDKYKKMLVAYQNLKGTYDSIKVSEKSNSQYFFIKKKTTVYIKTNMLTIEQKINVWTGRIFWLIIILYIIYKLKK